jgi:hypothetical protein
MLRPAARAEAPLSGVLRLPALLCAGLFAAQCVWLVLTELVRPTIDQLPTDKATATAAAQKRDAAWLAASIGAVRGDLWAQSAYTYSNLLWSEIRAEPNSSATAAFKRASESLDRALTNGPQQSGAWLLLAGLRQQFESAGTASADALKMAYYTGPSEHSLIPLRLRIAVRLDKFDDFEIRQFVSRDLRLLLAQKQRSTITQAYRVASPAGRNFMEQAIKDIDPSALSLLRTAERLQSLPD